MDILYNILEEKARMGKVNCCLEYERRSRLASLFEGGGSPKGLTEGVSHQLRKLPQSKIGSEEPIFAT